MAKERGEDVVFVGSTCLCDGVGRELRRDVGIERLAERELVERQGQGENSVVSFLGTKEPAISAALAACRKAYVHSLRCDTDGNAASDVDVFTDPLASETASATFDPNVETTTLRDGSTTTVTLITPTSTPLVAAPTAPTSSVSFNTNAGIPSSTTGLVKPTATDAPSNSSSPQDSAAQQSSDSTGSLSQSAKIGLGVGIGVGVPLLLALTAFLFLRRRKKRSHRRMPPKYETQGRSDLSMIETPHPRGMSASREPLHPHPDEVSKSFDSQQYQAYQPPPPPPINTFAEEDVFQTPISAVTRSELRTPTSDGRPMSRNIPGGPPVLTIPEPDATPLHSRDASIDGGVSPVSPVSPVSAVSPVGSRAPLPKQQH